VQAEGARGSITLNRPEKLNPLGLQTLSELIEAVQWFDRRAEVKIVTIAGRGRAFCAGADVGSFAEAGDGARAPREAADAGRLMAEAIESMRAVTVASIHGHCVGGGVVLAAACDLRLAAQSTRFSIPEVDLGIPLAWGGIPRLVREIGPAMTKELVMSCRPFTAEEGRALGFINRVVGDQDLEAATELLAVELARKSSLTLTATKLAVNSASREMASTAGSWNDADTLLGAFSDPESRRVGQDYLKRLRD
jgi:enoyl-CoA hydratase/carnithine racemase